MQWCGKRLPGATAKPPYCYLSDEFCLHIAYQAFYSFPLSIRVALNNLNLSNEDSSKDSLKCVPSTIRSHIISMDMPQFCYLRHNLLMGRKKMRG